MKFLLSPNGRTSRAGFWVFIAIAIGLSLAGVLFDQLLGTYDEATDTGVFELVVSLLLIWPSIAVSIKRFHDRGMTGWWVLWFALLSVVPLFGYFFFSGGEIAVILEDGTPPVDAGLSPLAYAPLAVALIAQVIQFVILAILPGQKGENKYGPDPLAK